MPLVEKGIKGNNNEKKRFSFHLLYKKEMKL
jgi:hypothetical protein